LSIEQSICVLVNPVPGRFRAHAVDWLELRRTPERSMQLAIKLL
jgi:hypothetical protein